MNRKEKGFAFITLILLVILAVVIIFVFKNQNNNLNYNNSEDEIIRCIAENSVLYVSKTCGHCAAQKEILGEHLSFFEIIDCTTEQNKCAQNEIMYVPTWIINGKKYVGKKSLNELKGLTGC